MRRTRLTIASLSMAASAMVLGMPAATAATVSHQAGTAQVTVVADDHSDNGNGYGQGEDDRRRRHRRVKIRRHHDIRWHHRCGPGWDSGWVRGRDRDRFRDRDRDRDRGGEEGSRRERDRDFRDNGDRGWGRGWISRCEWRRGEREREGEREHVEYAAPTGAVRAGTGGSVSGIGTPEIAAGGALAALGLAGAFGATRRRSSSH